MTSGKRSFMSKLQNRFTTCALAPKSVAQFLTALGFVLGLMAFTATSEARGAPDSFADLAQRLLPAVVNISTTSVVTGNRGQQQLPQFPPGSPFEDFFKDFFDRNQPQQRQRRATSLGSGFIIDGAGTIITNNHVIQDAEEITVILHDDTRLKATLVGRDPKTDIAVLKVTPKSPLSSVKFGNSNTLRVGDWVVAIGNPFGLGGSVTAGIVSARGRNINSGPYDDFIQTDASINRGNSGGPLFNLDGDVVGINTAIFSPTGGSVGIGFSIPSSTAKGVIDQLRSFGRTRRGWLGVRIQQVTDEIAESLGLDKARGALVASVTEGSPAESGAIKSGDIILTFNGKPVSEMKNLPRIVAGTEIGKQVKVEVWRDRKLVVTELAVGELKEEQVASRPTKDEEETGKPEELLVAGLGLSVARLNSSLRKKFKLKDNAHGVVVVKVEEGGGAQAKGIRPGDVIVEISQDDVRAPKDVVARVKKAQEDGRKSVLMLVEGQSGLRFVALQLAAKK
ncbi:MAG: Do family serine endopeptidase [Rhodospirillaceae bacterium]|nr:Do family serine endopeptidase [Rhodospirillaceae bacterium]MBT4672404.1 Do family serine endopeptidase [Rhodospirillaceae bacterium]MBT5839117.1 Do family serine endopeptidase [Rhodospirillaceae bacterium]MBT7030235.1 Do family serine endopeptidase [Rhodospirillaceae bacterium]MBT7234381.1 Do family serine endopeptidase [Rhodospirillaceae bacterium]